MWKLMGSCAVLTTFILNVSAADGFAVNVDYSGWDGNYTTDATVKEYAGVYLDKLSGPLKLYRTDFANNTVSPSVVICNDPCAYPAINLTGDRVVFYRKDASNQWHISIVNKDGTGLDDLADVASNSGAVLEWPQGNYVYYAKTLSGEFWKVNVNNKADKQVVWQPTETGPETWRFTMPADGEGCAFRGFGEDNMAFNCFPPQESCKPTLFGISKGTVNDQPRVQSCNIQITASGSHLFTYINNTHTKFDVHNYNRTANEVSYNIRPDSRASMNGDSPGGFSAYIRSSCNSDKWLVELQQSYVTPVAVNWVDEESFPIGANRSNGDLWIQPPSGSEGMIETSSGDWIDVDGTSVTPRNLEQKASAKPSHMVSPKLRIRSLQGSMTPEIYLGNQSRRVDIRGRVLPAQNL